MGNRRLTLDFPYFKGGALVDDTVELIRENLGAVGIEVQTRKPANYDSLTGPLANGTFDIAWVGFQSDPLGDMWQSVECDQIPPRGVNIGRFCDRVLDGLREKFTRTYDVSERSQLFQQEARRIAAEALIVVLYAWTQGYAYSSNLAGFHPGVGLTPFDNVMQVDI